MWGTCVLPALFPFFVFSSILTKLQVFSAIGNKLTGFMEKIFHCPGVSGIIYLFSIISGYPVGAKITSQMYLSGEINRDEVVRINSFTSTSGPLFIIGSVGVGMFVNHVVGIIMLISHILGAFCNGILYRNYHYIENIAIQSEQTSKTEEILSKSMYDSIISILVVGGYIVIFNIIIDMLCNVGVLHFLGSIISITGINANICDSLLNGILEVTRGCKDLAASDTNLQIMAVLGCMLISWGGFSIHLQALTFLSKCHISTKFYLLQKFTHCILSGMICFLLSIVFL